MQEIHDAIIDDKPLKSSIFRFKNNRRVQIISILLAVLLLSIPVYSMYSKYQTPDDEYQRDLQYLIDSDYGSITWSSQSNLELNDQQVFSLAWTNEDFPEEVKEKNIISIYGFIQILDFNEDNEETSGAGCTIDSGEDALDSATLGASIPNREAEIQETQTSTNFYFEFIEYPVFTTYPFITGYTVKEIEDMFETDKDELVGEYNFEITGMVEAGESTFQCDREDPSVTIYYSIEFEWLEVSVIEWNGDSIWF
jgi:hypothetical protein